MVAAFGERATARLEQLGLLNFTSRVSQWPEAMRRGAQGNEYGVYHNGKAYYALDNIPAGEVVRTVLHEVGEHFGLKGMLGEKAYAKLGAAVTAAHKARERSVHAAWLHVESTYPYEPGSEKFLAEVIAKVGEDQKVHSRSWWKQMVDAIRSFLIKLGLNTNMIRRVVAEDLQLLLRASVRHAARGEASEPSMLTEAAFARGDDLVAREAALRREILDAEDAIGYHTKQLNAARKFAPRHHPDEAAELIRQEERSVRNATKALERARSEHAKVAKELERLPAIDDPRNQLPLFSRTDGAPTFYSDLARQVEGIKTESAPASQWIGTLKGLKGVKVDELEWSGVLDWLGTREGKVTKAEVQAFLEQNGVKVEETMLGGEASATSRMDQLIVDLDSRGYSLLRENDPNTQQRVIVGLLERGTNERLDFIPGEGFGSPRGLEIPSSVERIGRELAGLEEQTWADEEYADPGETKFSQYTLPGGQNYRELLLTLPEKLRTPGPMPSFEDWLAEQPWRQGGPYVTEHNQRVLYKQWVERESKTKVADFRSSHFDQPNILAHVRFDERTDAEGKRVLFIEEFQSDWAQKGKREGFDTPETRAEQAEAKRRVEEIDAKIQEIHAEYGDGDGNHARFLRELPAEVQDRYADLVKAREDVGFKARYGQRVPAAPFVGKTEAWVALAVKRMVKYAVDNGFDRVAWTRGDQQADRYSLRKQVDSISWESVDAKMNGNGASRRVNISLKEPHRQLMNLGVNEDGVVVGARFGRDHDQFTGKRLEEVIGKTATEKVMGSPNGYLADEGLNIGGEGMIAFYDRIVPGTIRDVLRKLGVRAHAAGPQTEGPQVVRDRGLVNTQAIRDLALSQAFVDKGFEGLDAKAKRLVQAGMLALSKDDQILKAVVRAVPVDVVNVLRAKKLSPEMFFHDPAMLVNDLARDLRADMPGGVDVGTALVRAIAKAGAEDVAARAPRVTGGAVERVAASGAFANGHGEIVRLIDIPGLGPQPGFDITPALRERAAGGMPMFSRPQLPGVPPAQGSGPPRRNTPLGLQGGQAGNNASWDAPAPGKLDNLLYTLQDKHIDTKRVVQAVRASGREIADRWNPYLQEELYHGRTAKGTTEFIEKELKPLVVDMATRKVGMAEFEEYLHARHAEERNVQIAKVNPEMPDGGSGMETADARAYLAGLDPGKRRAYEALAKRVDAITKNTRQALVDYHLESPETVQAWEAAYGSYVPLMRDDDTGMGTGQGYSVKGSSSKRATGSSREVVNIIANIAMQRERAITRGEKNRVALALYGLAKMNPNPSFWKTDMPPTIRTVNEATGLVQDTVDPLYKSRDNVVMARVRNPKTGQISELSVIFNERDERAMRMSGSLKNIDADQLGVVLGTSAKITRYFASINTQYNPVFGVVNLTRDFQGALVNLSSTPLAGKQRVIIGDTLSALRGVYIDSRDQRKGVAPTSSWANLWEEFQREGGQTGYRDMFRTSKDRADAIASELKKITEGKAKKVGRAVFNWLDDYNNAMENAVRLAAYKAGKNQGLTNQQAASIAKNLTVNFNRKGQAALQAGALYAFFNASVQGTTRLAQTLAGPAGKKIVLGGLILGSLQALMLAAAGYDEDEPPEFLRERSLIIPIGERRYVSVPMPLGLHVLPNLSRIATEFALSGFKAPGKRIAQLVGVLVEAFNPIGTSGLSVQTIAPTAVDPLVALAENRDWTGKPIAREDMNPLQPTPGHTRSRDTASWWGKHISEGINFLSGGTKYTPGIASPTPDQVDYLIGQVTGGLGRETTKLAETVESQITGEELPPYKIPLVGRFYGNADSQSSQTSRFYANLKELGAHELEVKGRIKDRQSPAAYIKEHPEARLYPLADKTERDVSKLRKQKRELLAQEASRDRIRLIESQINAMMTRFNERVDEAKRAAAAP